MSKYQRTRRHLYSTTALAMVHTAGELERRLKFDTMWLVDQFRRKYGPAW